MPMQIDNMEYGNLIVNTKLSDVLFANLFYDSVFQPGVTYTDRFYVDRAGQIYAYRLKPKTVKVTKPAQKLEHQENELINFTLYNTFSSSQRMFEVQQAALDIPLIAKYMALASREISQAWNLSGLACLLTEGQGVAYNAGIPTDLDSLRKDILAAKTQLWKNKCEPSIVICTPDFYSNILLYAGQEYTPGINDRMVYSGEVGTWLGLTFINSNLLQPAAGEFKYYNTTMEEKTVAAESVGKIGYIMYDPKAFTILTNFNSARVIDDKDYDMVRLMEVSMNSGFKVTFPEAVLVRKYKDEVTLAERSAKK